MFRRLIPAALLGVLFLLLPAAPVVAHGDEDAHQGPLTVTHVTDNVDALCRESFVGGAQLRVQGEGFLPNGRVTVTFASPVDGLTTYPVLIANADGKIDTDLVLPAASSNVATAGLLVAKGPGPEGHDPLLSARISLQASDSLCAERLREAGAIVDDSGRAPAADADRPSLRPDGSPVTSTESGSALPWTTIAAGSMLLAALGLLGYALKRRR